MKFDKFLIHYSNHFYFVVLTSGILIWFFKEFLSVEGEWGNEPHFMNVYLRLVHHFASIFFIWFIGAMCASHVTRFIQKKSSSLKTSGMVLLTFSVLSIFSGSLLYHISEKELLNTAEIIHVVFGFLVLLAFLLHRVLKKS